MLQTFRISTTFVHTFSNATFKGNDILKIFIM